jgi:hypothetical protein
MQRCKDRAKSNPQQMIKCRKMKQKKNQLHKMIQNKKKGEKKPLIRG